MVIGLWGLPAWADPRLGNAPGLGREAAVPMLSCKDSMPHNSIPRQLESCTAVAAANAA